MKQIEEGEITKSLMKLEIIIIFEGLLLFLLLLLLHHDM